MHNDDRRRRYVDAAISAARGEVAAANPGARHNTVNRAAFGLGRLVGAGVLSYADAERELLAVAPIGDGYPESRAQSDVTGGLRDGLKSPAVVPKNLTDAADSVHPRERGGARNGESKNYLAPAAVLALWRLCRPVVEDDAVTAYLASRGIDAYALACLDMARTLPTDVQIPGWASIKGQPWTKTGHRLLVLLWSHDLHPYGIIARQVTAWDGPKSVSPAGYSRAGLAMLDYPAGVLLRRARWPIAWPGSEHPVIVIAEGEIDAMLWATRSDATQICGVIGIISGSWRTEWALAIPRGTRTIVATDDDEAGDKYAKHIMTGLETAGHIPRRWKDPGRGA
jgi:hypothetical protein